METVLQKKRHTYYLIYGKYDTTIVWRILYARLYKFNGLDMFSNQMEIKWGTGSHIFFCEKVKHIHVHTRGYDDYLTFSS